MARYKVEGYQESVKRIGRHKLSVDGGVDIGVCVRREGEVIMREVIQC